MAVEKILGAILELTALPIQPILPNFLVNGPNWQCCLAGTVKLGKKERFDKEQIGIKESFPVTNLPFTS